MLSIHELCRYLVFLPAQELYRRFPSYNISNCTWCSAFRMMQRRALQGHLASDSAGEVEMVQGTLSTVTVTAVAHLAGLSGGRSDPRFSGFAGLRHVAEPDYAPEGDQGALGAGGSRMKDEGGKMKTGR